MGSLDHMQCSSLLLSKPSWCRLDVSIEELDWDSPCSHCRLEELGALRSDYVIAADCLYTDEARYTLLCWWCASALLSAPRLADCRAQPWECVLPQASA